MSMHELQVWHLRKSDLWRDWPDGEEWAVHSVEPGILTTDHESCEGGQPRVLLRGEPLSPLDCLQRGLLPVCSLDDLEHHSPEELGLCLLWRTWYLNVCLLTAACFREEDFSLTWDQLAAMGACDVRGGREWLRIHHDWVAAGRPGEPHEFILDRAHWPGQDRGGSE